jgi:hypothetical protein
MIIDGHVHQFSSKIVQNVSQKKEMVRLLQLQVDEAWQSENNFLNRLALVQSWHRNRMNISLPS